MTDKTLEMIMKRRSVRSFTGAAITKEQIETILKAAMAAPSANNSQPWEFVVVTARERIEQICNAHPYAKFGVHAGAVVIPFGDERSSTHFLEDMAAATENPSSAIEF